jgi:hypothetical protein
VAVGIVLTLVGFVLVMTGAGLTRFVPSLPDPTVRVPVRQRFGLDPSTRSRPQAVILLMGAVLLVVGVLTLAGILLYRA